VRKGAQAKDAGKCEQTYAIQDFSYRQVSALLSWTRVSFVVRASRLWRLDSLVPDAELGKVIEESEYLQKPKNDGNHDNAIQDALDLALHGDEAVYQP
jgi:hypothetical protein